MWDRVFGGMTVPADDDLIDLVGRADPATLPPLWLGAGTADHVYPSNLSFVDACAAAAIPVETSFVPDAEHEWGLWDAQIQRVLDWLPIRPAA